MTTGRSEPTILGSKAVGRRFSGSRSGQRRGGCHGVTPPTIRPWRRGHSTDDDEEARALLSALLGSHRSPSTASLCLPVLGGRYDLDTWHPSPSLTPKSPNPSLQPSVAPAVEGLLLYPNIPNHCFSHNTLQRTHFQFLIWKKITMSMSLDGVVGAEEYLNPDVRKKHLP